MPIGVRALRYGYDAIKHIEYSNEYDDCAGGLSHGECDVLRRQYGERRIAIIRNRAQSGRAAKTVPFEWEYYL
jgi:hypothetical protein